MIKSYIKYMEKECKVCEIIKVITLFSIHFKLYSYSIFLFYKLFQSRKTSQYFLRIYTICHPEISLYSKAVTWNHNQIVFSRLQTKCFRILFQCFREYIKGSSRSDYLKSQFYLYFL